MLFVAREPDETLRTFLPILAELKRRGRPCLALFHHEPGRWALERLAELGVPWLDVCLPARQALPGPLAAAGELHQLWQTRRLARRLIGEIDPSAVVVIQDTLLLERFLVREANRRGRGTLVVQWAFTYPQSMYDRLNEIKKAGRRAPRSAPPPPRIGERGGGPGGSRGAIEAGVGVIGRGQGGSPGQGGSRAPFRRRLYALAQYLLGVRFELVNSYGGGEARVFAVMGEAFKEQFLAQGVRKERIEVTGHPLHDLAFARRAEISPKRSAELKARYGLGPEARVILYATQPVLWRAVVTRDELVSNVRALGRAVAALGPDFVLVLKLHPRESSEAYAPALQADLPIRLIEQAEIADLIAPADAFISSSSSTVLLAMMLDKPIVTVNFNDVPHFDYYESVGGTLHARTPEAAAEALRRAIFDEPTRARLATERTEVLARYARFDGRATERLAVLVDEL